MSLLNHILHDVKVTPIRTKLTANNKVLYDIQLFIRMPETIVSILKTYFSHMQAYLSYL